MTFFALTENRNLYQKVAQILDENFGCRKTIEIAFGGGKPTFAGAYSGAYDFNVSHSGGVAAVAVSDKKTGCDIELLKGRERAAVIRSFTPREAAEISDEMSFLYNWTAKEAFIKMNGFTLAAHMKRLEYADGKIFLDEKAQECVVRHFPFDGGVACVCGDGDIHIIAI